MPLNALPDALTQFLQGLSKQHLFREQDKGSLLTCDMFILCLCKVWGGVHVFVFALCSGVKSIGCMDLKKVMRREENKTDKTRGNTNTQHTMEAKQMSIVTWYNL